MKKGKRNTLKIVSSGLFIAIGIILPFFTGQIPEIGKMLLPMHIPVFLCGFLCGPLYGGAVGFITPILRSAIFGMPPFFPNALIMAFELLVYGLASGFLFESFPKKRMYIYLSLILSMILGRIFWGILSFLVFTLLGNSFTWEAFMSGALFTAIPGIILQIVLIPPIVIILKKGYSAGKRGRKYGA